MMAVMMTPAARLPKGRKSALRFGQVTVLIGN
jgi:hypothetical protein